jgi:peptidoglycan/LPS O-acetylase OafA/YrhL
MTEGSRTRYWPALDGIRAVAVGLVVAYHLAPASIDRGGTIGVTMFFTLSGFLITTLLLAEADRAGSVSLRRFYLRRALRLLPALVLLVPVVVAYATASDREDDTIAAVPAVLLYVGNWVRAFDGFNTLGMFEHAWSLAVEEQFYVIWPLVVVGVTLLVGRRRRAHAVLVAALVGSVASLLVRLALWNDADPIGSAARLVNGTDAVADQLLIGCALGAALHILSARRQAWTSAGDRALSPPPQAVLRLLGPTALAFLVWVSIARPGGASVANNHLYLTWGATAFSLAAAVVVLASVADEHSLLSRVLSLRPLVSVGRVSYGVYLWHFPVILTVQSEMSGASVTVQRATALVLTALATAASWHLVERPTLALKGKLAPAPAEPPSDLEAPDAVGGPVRSSGAGR